MLTDFHYANKHLHKYLAFSCVAYFRTYFLEISLPHTLVDALGVDF